jgi:predicted DNA-binding transcriptional regulator YafY
MEERQNESATPETFEEQVSRVFRLLWLIQEIRNNPRQTLQGLMSRAGISRSQFYKDKATLAGQGFVFEYRKRDGFKIVEDRLAPVCNLTMSDRMTLMFALQHLSVCGDGHLAAKALEVGRKLVGGLDEPFRGQVMEVFNRIVVGRAYGCKAQILEELRKAVEQGARVRIKYVSSTDWQAKWYEVDPRQIYFLRRTLFLYARCPKLEPDMRSFRISRIKEVAPTGMSVPSREDEGFYKSLANAFDSFIGPETETVHVRFKGAASRFVRENFWHVSQRIEKHGDDEITFQVDVAEPREVMWWAMQFGHEAEILEPVWLRREAAEAAMRTASVYSQTGTR